MSQPARMPVFKMADAFPSTDPVSVFVAAFSIALDDLARTNKWLVGGDDEAPGRRDVRDSDERYLLRLGIVQLFELRKTIANAQTRPSVESFIATLPEAARAALAVVMDPNAGRAGWVYAAMEHVRNQTVHYGGKHHWDDVEWALRILRDNESRITWTTPTFAGMYLEFADLVSLQQLARKFPDYAVDDEADISEDMLKARLSTLVSAVSDVTVAALTFGDHLLTAFLQQRINDGVVRFE